MNLNRAIVLGRVTADPQLRTTAGGQSVTSFGVATNRTWTDKDGKKQEDAEFHNIVCWGKQAEVARNYLKKGSLVLVEGRLATRSWTDKQNQQRKATEIIAEHLQLGPKPQSGTGMPAPKVEDDEPVIRLDEEEIRPEDLPF
jgi:single-strand DNA-binding protein